MLKKIELEEFKNLYQNHIIHDFKQTERPPLSIFKKRIKKGLNDVYIFMENQKEIAYVITAENQEFVLILFLAVFKDKRGNGIGSKLLEEIKNKFKEKKGIILEVESVEYSENEQDKQVREKRIKFYQKNNYQIIENIDYIVWGEHYNLMIQLLKGNDISKEETIENINKIYKELWGILFQKAIKYEIK